MNNCIEITLNGTQAQLAALFSYTKEEQDSKLSSLDAYIAHAFNMTLVRDGFYGAWAEVLINKGKYILKMYCVHHDLSIYHQLIPAYLEAGKLALSIWKKHQNQITSTSHGQMQFLLPFGLSMARAKSVQLLHFPPLETFVYQDYLYSPTNRRWENLLAYNGIKAINYPELESIVDCVPIAAPGNDDMGIAPYNQTFTPYVKSMLQARLIISGRMTQPVVAYGDPVREWLDKAFAVEISKQVKGPLDVPSLVQLQILDKGPKTWVLCANHPSKYLYFTDDDSKVNAAQKREIIIQDLIASGWQARMAFNTKLSPKKVLEELTTYWTGNKQVDKIMKQEDVAYGYKL